MKKHIMKKALALILSCALVGSMSGCSLPFGNKDKEEEEEEESAGIEASVSKIKIEVGEEDEIEIKNFEDLKKLDFEVDDESIATVEEDDEGVYIVTGISEGKTSVTFTAKDCEDLTIKITVEGGMEPQPTTGGTFELSEYDTTVDYDDYGYYVYINNWEDIKDACSETITVTSSDSAVLAPTFDEADGSIYLCVWDEGYATVTVEADGFEPAYINVECTHSGGGSNPGGSNPGGSTGDGGITVNNDGSIDVYSSGAGSVVAQVYCPNGYTLDDVNSTSSAVFFDCDDGSGQYITVWAEMPYTEWDYVENGNAADGFTMDITELGEYNGNTVYVADRHDPDNQYGEIDMVQIFFPYETDSYTDYVTLEIYPELLDGYDADDLWTLFCQVMDY